MTTMNMTAEQAKNYYEAQVTMGTSVINAIKKYFSENREVIVSGLASMNGQIYIPTNRR